jgi:serine/threonine-protein kinase
MTAESSNNAAQSMETELGRLVVDRRLATQEEVDQAVEKVSNGDPGNQTLAQVLVRDQIVTPSQLERLQSQIEESRKGRQIPGYQILGKLGSGAMATTFKAKQISLDRLVAIKVLPRRLSENSDYVERFYREGQAAAKLNHANIAQAFDVGEAGGYHYFVMEYVEGHTLYDEIAAGKVFSESDALTIVLQLARALEHAHGQGLIHRDVKPKNVMITPGGQVKLVDMGLARSVTNSVVAQAEAGKAFGTPYYISPEQIRGEVDIDFRADIYSLGATLYHMVTGRVPFEGDSPTAVMHKHLKETLTPPDHINTSLSAGLGEVVEVMMAKDRNRRYRSTSDMLLDLEAIAQGEPPLQARKNIGAGVLEGLAEGVDEQGPAQEETAAPQADNTNFIVVIIILSAVLLVSLLMNVFQLLT